MHGPENHAPLWDGGPFLVRHPVRGKRAGGYDFSVTDSPADLRRREEVWTRSLAAQVDSRTTNSGFTITSSGSLPPLRRSSRMRAAVVPIIRNGWRTVVRLGFWKAALAISSKPTTEISSGTRSPRSRIARIAPMAERSL